MNSKLKEVVTFFEPNEDAMLTQSMIVFNDKISEQSIIHDSNMFSKVSDD